MKRIWDRIFEPINTAFVTLLTLFTTVWGLFILNPMVHSLKTSESLMFLLMIAPEWGWGLFALLVGIIGLYGTIRPSYKSITKGAYAGAIHWFIVGCLCLLGDWHNVNWIMYLAGAVYSAFVYLNLRVNKHRIKF